jgi:hypothetical protein
VNTSALLDAAVPLIAHGLAGILYHRRASGAWGWRTYVDTAPSPSKTALCLMAVDAATGGPARADGMVVETGGAGGQAEVQRVQDIIAAASGWLARNHHRWESFVEDDKDVQGTAWEHMAYALGVQAVLRADGDPYDQRLSRAWQLMNDLWDDEADLWGEPGASGRRATIRAAFHTVCAYEEAKTRLAATSLAEGNQAGSRAGNGVGDEPEIARLVAVEPMRAQILVSFGGTPVPCAVPERVLALAAILAGAGPGAMTVADIATAMYVAPSSVAKYVQRLNRAVSDALGGADAKLVVACRTPGGSGYALADRSASTG